MLNATAPHTRCSRPLLVIAHPGHELRLVAWLNKAHPDVVVLTDGSGGDGQPRVDATQRIVSDGGGHACALFGAYADRQIYQAMLSGSVQLFLDMASQLITQIRLGGYHTIVRDPYEGYNPTHDVCAVLVDVAVALVWRRYGQRIRVYDFPLTPLSDFRQSNALRRYVLTDAERVHKRAIVTGYRQLEGEVNAALQREGASTYAEEVLRQLSIGGPATNQHLAPPFYETYGEGQRLAGRYTTVIRYAEHLAPIEIAIKGLMRPVPDLLQPDATQQHPDATTERVRAQVSDAT